MQHGPSWKKYVDAVKFAYRFLGRSTAWYDDVLRQVKRGATLDAGVLSTALADLPAARHPDEVAVVAAEAIPLTDGYRPLKGELRSRWGVAFQPTFARRGSAWGAA